MENPILDWNDAGSGHAYRKTEEKGEGNLFTLFHSDEDLFFAALFGAAMKFAIFSGTGIAYFRETANSATEALERVRHLMKLRRTGVRVENELGHDVSFFQLKDAAASEKSADNLRAPWTSVTFRGGRHVRMKVEGPTVLGHVVRPRC